MSIAETFAGKFTLDRGRPSAVFFHLMLARFGHSHREGGRIRFDDGSEIEVGEAYIQRYGVTKTLEVKVVA